MTTLDEIASKIVKEQELIIGPLAWTQAIQVPGLHVVDQKAGTISIEAGHSSEVIDGLVSQYEHLFGRASVEVCKDAVSSLLAQMSPAEIPLSLK